MTFRAFRIADDKAPGRLVDATIDELTAGDVVIDVAYSSVNYKDALAGTATGKIVRKYPLVGGIDLAGTVRSSGDGRFREGQPVVVTGYDLGVAHDGGYAAVARVPADWVVPLPANLDLFESMAIGTAGFTAMLAVMALEDSGLKPGAGEVLVTGAAGGLGSVAVAILAKLGYHVAASTGRPETHDYLKSLGARVLIDRAELAKPPARPLDSERWAGCIDSVGSTTLATALTQLKYRAAAASCGLAGGSDLPATVLPFLLRGVRLIGIDSVMCPLPQRQAAWARLARDLPFDKLDAMTETARLADLPRLAPTILKGGIRGRLVVDVRG